MRLHKLCSIRTPLPKIDLSDHQVPSNRRAASPVWGGTAARLPAVCCRFLPQSKGAVVPRRLPCGQSVQIAGNVDRIVFHRAGCAPRAIYTRPSMERRQGRRRRRFAGEAAHGALEGRRRRGAISCARRSNSPSESSPAGWRAESAPPTAFTPWRRVQEMATPL